MEPLTHMNTGLFNILRMMHTDMEFVKLQFVNLQFVQENSFMGNKNASIVHI